MAGLALTACGVLTKMAYSNVAFAYNQFPPMLTWMIDGLPMIRSSRRNTSSTVTS